MDKIYCFKDKRKTSNLFEKLKTTRNGKNYIEARCVDCKSRKSCFISNQKTFKIRKQRKKEKEMFDIGLLLARKIRNRDFKRKIDLKILYYPLDYYRYRDGNR